MTPFLFFANFGPALCVVALVIIALNFRSKQLYVKLLGLWLILLLVTHVSQMLFVFTWKINPNYVGNLALLIELPIISLVYYFATNRADRVFYLATTCFFVALALANFIFIQKTAINSYTLTTMSIFVVLYAVKYFYWLLKELPTTQLHRHPMFWVNSGFMVFFSGSLFVWIFTAYLVNEQKNNLVNYWMIHNILKIIEIIAILGAVWIDQHNIVKSRVPAS